MKNKLLLISFLVLGVRCFTSTAQVSPFFISVYGDPGYYDDATDRYYIQDIQDLPTELSFPLNNNIRSWVKSFFNARTGFYLGQESLNNDANNPYNRIECYYEHTFTSKTTPENETMGIATKLVYKNKNYVTYKAEFGSNGRFKKAICETELATFVRKDGRRLSLNDIFNCDESIIKEQMFKFLPDHYPCDLSSAKDIKILSAGIDKYTIDVVGTIYKNNSIVFEIPIESVQEYLTPLACSLNMGIIINRDEKIKSYKIEKNNRLEHYFRHLMRNESVTCASYYNDYLNKNFSIQIDAKYDFDYKDDSESVMDRIGEDYVSKESYESKNPKRRIYLEVPSVDETKEVYLEFSKSKAESFIDELKNQLKKYDKWVKKMESQKFDKYKLEKQGGDNCKVFYYRPRLGEVSYGYIDNREYVYQYTYDKKTGKTALLLKSVYKKGTQVDKKRFKISSDIKTSNNDSYEMIDPYNGYMLIFNEPENEISQLCDALQTAIQQLK